MAQKQGKTRQTKIQEYAKNNICYVYLELLSFIFYLVIGYYGSKMVAVILIVLA
jgi:hypothetical protein